MSAEIIRNQITNPSDRIIVAYDGLVWSDIIEAENYGLTRAQAAQEIANEISGALK